MKVNHSVVSQVSLHKVEVSEEVLLVTDIDVGDSFSVELDVAGVWFEVVVHFINF